MSALVPWRAVDQLVRSSAVPAATAAGLRRSGVRLAKGCFVPGEWWQAAPLWEKYRAVLSARTVMHPGTVFCCRTALLLHGVALGHTPSAVFVAAATRSEAGRHPSSVVAAAGLSTFAPRTHVHVHPAFEPQPVGDFSVMPLDLALSEVMAREPVEASLPGLDAALRARAVTVEGLGALAEAQPLRTRREQAIGVLAEAEPRSESAGESLSRVAMLRLGVQRPEVQVEIEVLGRRLRLDFAWPGVRVAGECDGRQKYLDSSMRAAGASEWDVLKAEQMRDALIRREYREVVHWSAEDRKPITRLRDKLVVAGVPVDARTATRLR
ncbi:MAG: hypothetical protein LBE25_05510 [Arthrobacter sp.]|jgi:hypothetical protein|nr:hypothetical protein [Arthrobacter sp.]